MVQSTFWYDRQSLVGLVRKLQGPAASPVSAPARSHVALEPGPRGADGSKFVAALGRVVTSEAIRTGDVRRMATAVAQELAAVLAAVRVTVYQREATVLRPIARHSSGAAAIAAPIDLTLCPAVRKALVDGGARAFTDFASADGLGLELVQHRAVGPTCRSGLLVAVQSASGQEGAMLLERDGLASTFTPDESQFASAVANVLALTMEAGERAVHEARLRDQAATLLRLTKSSTVGAADPLPAIREITRAASNALHVKRASVWFFDDAFSAIVCRDLYDAGEGRHDSGVRLAAVDYPKYFAALAEERFIEAHDAHTDPRTAEFSTGYLTPLGINSMLDAPIRVGQRMVGVLCHEHVGRPRRWTADEQNFAGALADLVALSVEASERKRTEIERAAREETLQRFNNTLINLTRSENLGRDVPEATREITNAAADALGVARASVWIYNSDRTSIYCVDLFKRDVKKHESGIELKSEQFPRYFAALEEMRIIDAIDAHTDPRTREFSATYLTPLGIHAMLDAPIRIGDRMIGVLCNEHTGAPRNWTLEEQQFAAALADLVALAFAAGERREAEAELREMLRLMEGGARAEDAS
jgi:GAF domain-containing protein